MRINQNISAFNAYRNLTQTNSAMGKSLEKLSSGFRINRAADDASGLVRSEGLRSGTGGTKVAIRNTQDGISFVQTAEGALNEVHSILQRMRDLAVSAANGTSDGTAEQAEFDELEAELTSIGSRTTFAGDAVFGDYSASGAAKNFHIGAGSSDVLAVTQNLGISVGGSSGVLGSADLTGVALGTDAGAQSAIAVLDTAISATSTSRSNLGATQNRLESAVRNLSVAAENLQAAESRIRDTDMAEEMVQFTRAQIPAAGRHLDARPGQPGPAVGPLAPAVGPGTVRQPGSTVTAVVSPGSTR